MKTKSPISLYITVCFTILLLFSAIFIWIGNRDSAQSSTPLVADVAFEGEYKIGEGEWYPIVKGKHIPSTSGDVTLRGRFHAYSPFTNEPIGPISHGTTVALYFNHINASIYLNTGHHLQFDCENEMLGEDACAVMWGYYTSTGLGESDGIITIFLHNPHSFGNENAIDDFLNNITIMSGGHFENTMLEKGMTERNIGIFIMIASLIILGIAAFSSIIRLKFSKEMWLIGFMSFSAGGYFLFDAFAVSIWNNSNITNTRVLGLSMMLYFFFTSAIVASILKGKQKTIASWAALASCFTVLACVLVSFTESIKFYDTWLYWALVELILVIILITCLISSIKRASPMEKLLYIITTCALVPFPVDFIATMLGWWEGGTVSKHVFLAVFTMTLIIVLRIIPYNISDALKARELEAEQQALKLELQESRISIMLSQMQPHFIFNTLNTIYHLCEIDPDIARKTISSFSEYLRNNIDNLGQSEMIPFEKELSFVKTYLDIEKVRFDDELEITFDIETSNFKLPVLTVQPIVENAVKHGTSKKEGVSRLDISTKETDNCYKIIIRDTGVGFDTSIFKTDRHKHIGISNVRQRLENMCNGTLEIDSEPNAGTTAIITIPKKEGPNNENIGC